MKIKNKLILILCSILLFTVFGFTIQAEEPLDVTTTTTGPSEQEKFQEMVEQYKYNTDVFIEYTHDSISSSGIDYEISVDPFTYIISLSLTKDLSFGHKIYDDPGTEIIDGIRVNGETITSLNNIVIDIAKDTEILIKIVYTEGIPGLLAKISDGTVTAEELLANPLILMQLVYYVIAVLSIIVGGLGVFKAKKKKIKTADDIASLIDSRTQEAQEALQTKFLSLIDETLLPLIQKTVDTNKQVVKAITLSTSKMKEAPIALLDTLKEIGDIDTNEMLESAKTSVIKNMKQKEKEMAEITEALQNIAGKPDEKKSVF